MSGLLEKVKFKDCSNWSVSHLIGSQFNYNQDYELVRIGDFLTRNRDRIDIKDTVEYTRVKIKINNNGVFVRDKVMGKDIGTKKQFLIKEGQFLLSKIDARNGAFGLATNEVDNAIITADFFAYEIDKSKIEPYFLVLMTTTKKFKEFAQGASSGTTGRQRIDEKKFLDVKIPLPLLKKQKEIIRTIKKYEIELICLEKKSKDLLDIFNKNIFTRIEKSNKLLTIINFLELNIWSVHNLSSSVFNYNKDYSLIRIGTFIKRNKTPINIQNDLTYKRVTIRSKNNGVLIRDKVLGKNIGTKNQFIIKEGQFLLSKIDARNGAFGIATKELDGAIITADFFAYDIDKTKINPYFLSLITTTEQFIQFAQNSSTGTTNRQRINEKLFLDVEIPLPSIDEQEVLVNQIKNNLLKKEQIVSDRLTALAEFEKGIFDET